MVVNILTGVARSVGLSTVMRVAGVVTRLLPVPTPTMMVGPGASRRLGQAINDFCHRKILIVTDATISRLGLMQPMIMALTAGGTAFVVFDEISADAPIDEIEKGVGIFKAEGCDAIIAFGGGSAMDAAKVIGLSAANHKRPQQLVGYFKGLHAPPATYAVPTTAGTGSEVTVAAVVSDPATQRKLVIADTRLVPTMAALDPSLMTSLPKDITAATGMDALTHAIEAFVGHWGSAFTDRMALTSVSMIYRNLPVAYATGEDLGAREKMALAASYAGQAFTRANVGYVHAIAHQLGGLYHTPHGLANAIMLPHVLRFLSPAIIAKLAVLAIRVGLGQDSEPEAELAEKFLDSIDAMNARLGIPSHLEALRAKDIPALARAACREADLNYPVPRYMSQQECEQVIRSVLRKKALPRAKAKAKAKPATGKSAVPRRPRVQGPGTGAGKGIARAASTTRKRSG